MTRDISLKRIGGGARFDLLLAAAILATWVALIPRWVPDRSGDRGIFISVAARLLAGDRLYSDVWDNKEPLFYYFVALQVALGRWSEVAADALLTATAAFATFRIAMKLASKWTAVATSFIAVPIILTGGFYSPGTTELPGVVVALVAIAASALEQPVWAGACIGLLVFTKLIYVPVALMGVSCFLIMDRRFFDSIFLVLGAFIAMALMVGVLYVRDELSSFIETIWYNVVYSQGALIGYKTGLASLVAHIRRIGGWSFLAETVPMLLGIMLGWTALSQKFGRYQNKFVIRAASLAAFVASLVVLSITGLWTHHCEIMCISSVMIVLSLISLLDASVEIARVRTLGLIFLIGIMMSGDPASTINMYVKATRFFREAYAELNELSPETRRLLAIASSGAYARFGQNEDHGHAVGLSSWKLACPIFLQYVYYSTTLLNKAFECASTAQFLIISEGIRPDPDWPLWNEFVDRVEHLLVEDYACDASSGLRVCRRRPGE
jgi:hypothetical protein